jgi:biotin transport system permease protein
MAVRRYDSAKRNRPTPYSYRPGKSPLHKCPGAVKLLGLLCISAGSFVFGLPALSASTVLVIAASLTAGIRPWELFRGIRPIIIMIILILLTRSVDITVPAFTMSGFRAGILFGWAMILSFTAASLLFSVTTMTEIKDSLPRGRLSLGLSLMLGFMPRFFEIWENTELAYQARAGKPGPVQLITLIPLTIERMIECAVETASALEGRGLTL